jgi:hypothetical protein
VAAVLEADTAAAGLLDTVVEAALLADTVVEGAALLDVAAAGEALVVAADALAVAAAELAVLAAAVGTGAALLGAAELVAAAVLAVTEAAPPHAARTPIAGNATAAPSACRRSVRREVKDEPGMPTPLDLTNTDVITAPDPGSPITTSRLDLAPPGGTTPTSIEPGR